MVRVRLPLLILVLFVMVGSTAAQSVNEISIGETVDGAVTAEDVAPSFFFDADADQVLTVLVESVTENFVPVLLVASEDNTVLATYSTATGETSATGTFTAPSDGRYFVQVQGANGARGEFTITLTEETLEATTEASLSATSEAEAELIDATAEMGIIDEQAMVDMVNTMSAEMTAEATSDATNEVVEPDDGRLMVGDRVEGRLDADTARAEYTLIGLSAASRVLVETSATVTLTNTESGAILGSFTAPLGGGAFIIPPAPIEVRLTLLFNNAYPSEGYVITVEVVPGDVPLMEMTAEAAMTAEMTMQMAAEATPTREVAATEADATEAVTSETVTEVAAQATPQATFTPAPTLTPQATAGSTVSAVASPSPDQVDVVLRWDPTGFTAANVTDGPIDLEGVIFAGDNRNAGTDYWAQANPTIDLTQFPANTCGGFRPFGYGGPPALYDCAEIAAWWTDDIVYFWGGAQFDVLLNGVVIATCETVNGTCGVDLP